MRGAPTPGNAADETLLVTNMTPRGAAVARGWSEAGSGARYRGRRWRSKRAERRDPRLVAALIARYGNEIDAGYILDIPSGTGRLRGVLESWGPSYVGAELSEDMLRAGDPRGCVRADAASLPFPDDTFAAVVCCRLLHHLPTREERRSLLRELVRVSSDLLLVSFWNSTSWHALRRRRGWRRARHADHRCAISRHELTALLDEAGADVLGLRHSLRFVSPQAFVVARKRR